MKSSKTRTSNLLVVGAIAAVAGALVNAAVYGVGRAADVTFIAKQTAVHADHIKLVHVVGFSLETFVVGLVAAAVANRLRRPDLRTLQTVGAVLAVVSTVMDVSIDSTLAAKLTLACMHLVVGAAYVAALQVVRSARTTTSAAVTDLEPRLEAAIAA